MAAWPWTRQIGASGAKRRSPGASQIAWALRSASGPATRSRSACARRCRAVEMGEGMGPTYPCRVFNSLSDRLAHTFKNLKRKGTVTESDLNATIRDIRMALLDADVALPVVKQFTGRIRERALGTEVSKALNPAQQVVKIVHEELIDILGGQTRRLNLAKTPPTVIMLAGLQGSGKTTLAGKLGYWLKEQGHAPLLVAADLQRPNAVTQLQVVGERAGVPVFAPEKGNVGGHD